MTEETPPPTPVPPASQPPYPSSPEPKAHGEAPLPETPAAVPALVPGVGTLGMTLLGGALAAAVGVLVVRPFLKRRKAKPAAPKRATRTRTKK